MALVGSTGFGAISPSELRDYAGTSSLAMGQNLRRKAVENGLRATIRKGQLRRKQNSL
jgi:hypothetical protein